MTIVSSVLEQEPHTQADGRRWVTEVHTNHVGKVMRFARLPSVGEDSNAVMLARVASLELSDKAVEIEGNVREITTNGSLAITSLEFSTTTENLAAVREAYREATQLQAVMIGDFFNSLTDPQLRNLLNMTQTQVNNLRTNKLGPAATCAALVRAALGQ